MVGLLGKYPVPVKTDLSSNWLGRVSVRMKLFSATTPVLAGLNCQSNDSPIAGAALLTALVRLLLAWVGAIVTLTLVFTVVIGEPL